MKFMQGISKRFFIFIALAVVIAILPGMLKQHVPDSDMYFIRAAGEYITENHEVPTVNPFVIHEGWGIIVQQWLFDVMVNGVHQAFGLNGEFICLLALVAVFAFLLYKFISLFTQNQIVQAALWLAALFLIRPMITLRPTSFTMSVILALLYCLVKYYRTKKWPYLLALPVASLALANMHMSMWPMIFVFTLPFLAPTYLPEKGSHPVKGWFDRNKLTLLFAGIAAVAGLANPYGLTGISYIFRSYGAANKIEIAELAQPPMMSINSFTILITVAAITYFVMKNLKPPKKNAGNFEQTALLYLALGTMLMQMMHMRNIWFFIIGALPIFAMCLPKNEIKSLSDPSSSKMLTGFVAVLLVFGIGFSVFLTTNKHYAWNGGMDDSEWTPVQAVEYLDELNKDDIVLYTGFNNGAFFEANGYKAYMDARPELFAKSVNGKEDVIDEYKEILYGTADYKAFLEKYNFTHLAVHEDSFIKYLNSDENYKTAIEGTGYVLYERVH